MKSTVVYDACVLYASPLRDFLVRVAIEDLVIARWSDRILDEVFRSVLRDRPDLSELRLLRTRRLMCDAVLDCVVEPGPGLEAGLVLPDMDDRHVVATALKAGASAIVTFNLRDFPESVLSPLGLTATHPDDFTLELLNRDPATVVDVLHGQAADLRNPPRTTSEVVGMLERCGLPRFAATLRTCGWIA